MANELRIGVLGLGQIGGSIASRLSADKAYRAVVGFDLRRDLTDTALKDRVIKQIAASEQDLIDASDVVIVALPIAEIIAFLNREHSRLSGKFAVIDTGSVKQEIMTIAGDLHLSNFVGGHPLCGSERKGVAAWNAGLFEASTFFLMNDPRASIESLETARKIVLSLGATPTLIDSEFHDKVFALTSSLPHLAAFGLKRTVGDSPDLDQAETFLKTPSFLSATRVADSDPDMVFQMLWHNRHHVVSGLSALMDQLRRAEEALKLDDPSALRDFLALSKSTPKLE